MTTESSPVLITRAAMADLPTKFGHFQIIVYLDAEQKEQIALTCGDLNGSEPVLTRLHSECLTGDVFGSHRCDCGEQLAAALNAIQQAGRGVLLYLRQEGRGIGLVNKIRAYALQQQGLDTIDANRALGLPIDTRDYGVAAAILRDLGVHTVRLLTNNPAKITGLEECGITVSERVPLQIPANVYNALYLLAKQLRMGHLLDSRMLL
ncbi:GTP cyclohydrolase II [Chloroflexus aggregans]|uniref:GTP cyclohydrolase-2 n=1 Tax=Chloroflexus aggregans (strain MD-66 / DSM 9485) TaxID=326427 RepID=B8G828_CHLAD|nr:GTP cyclohydrolase II [Chloroflexus aggregans]ACL24207.1 GTP cyclohydrolase II [Chloroflexus aggregans DSM 9485]